MMIPASAGWQPEAAATSGVIDDSVLVVSDDAAGMLLPLLGIAALIGAAYMMESAQVEDEDDDDLEVDIDEDDEDDFDDYDDEDDEDDED